MEFHDFSKIQIEKISLRIKPRVLFFMNRSGNFEISLDRIKAETHVFALFIGTDRESFDFSLTQLHRKQTSNSSATVLAILTGHSLLHANGLVRIEENAQNSNASQTHRTILLSEHARSMSKPSLEILAEDVSARHASATGMPDPDTIFSMRSRGIPESSSKKLVAIGEVNEFFSKMRLLSNDQEIDRIEKLVVSKIQKI